MAYKPWRKKDQKQKMLTAYAALICFMFVSVCGQIFYQFYWQHGHPKISNESIEELKASFPDFISTRVSKERKLAILTNIEVGEVTRMSDNTVNLNYTVTLEEPSGDDKTVSRVTASTELKKDRDTWIVVKISNKTEFLDFAEGMKVKAD